MLKLSQLNKFVWLTFIAFASTQCNEGNFRSSGNAVKQVSKVISIGCSSNAEVEDSTGTGTVSSNSTEVTGLSGSKVKIKGEFCSLDLTPTAAPTDIVFVVDFSGSMREADPTNLVAGCGRLQAAKDYVAGIESQIAAGTANDISIGVISFDEKATVKAPLTKLADFKTSLTNANFCGQAGTTNYEDAFEQANIMLSSRQSTKVIYFISDGQPAAYGISPNGPFLSVSIAAEQAIPIQKGRDAAKRLRDATPGLNFYAIFLDKNAKQSSFDPNAYLAELTGDPKRVAVVTNANQLATKIVTFEPPKPLSVEESSVNSLLSADGFGDRKVEMEYFKKDTSRENFYIFETKDVELFGKKGSTVVNQLSVKAKSSDGTVPEINAEIRFQLK
jgi:uncharacterized protein YegL